MGLTRSGVLSESKEIQNFSNLPVSYLLFYDVLHTVGGVATSFAENDLRLPVLMNFVLILLANIIAIPMSVVGGMLAARYGAKSVLGGSSVSTWLF